MFAAVYNSRCRRSRRYTLTAIFCHCLLGINDGGIAPSRSERSHLLGFLAKATDASRTRKLLSRGFHLGHNGSSRRTSLTIEEQIPEAHLRVSRSE